MKRTPKKLLATLLALAMLASLCVVPAAAADYAAPQTPSYDGEHTTFFANGTPITISARTDGQAGAMISWGTDGSQAVGADCIVYGGGHNHEGTYESSSVTMNGGTLKTIYGGGLHKSRVETTNVVISGGTITEAVCGGGAASAANNTCYLNGCTHTDVATQAKNSVTYVGTANVTINDIARQNTWYPLVYGGGQGYSRTDVASVTIAGGNPGYVIAGGSNGYTGTGTVNVQDGHTAVIQGINRGSMDTIAINVAGGSVDTLYVGGESPTTDPAGVNGDFTSAALTVTGGRVGELKPGSSAGSVISGEALKKLDIHYIDGTIAKVPDVFKDGKYADFTNATPAHIVFEDSKGSTECFFAYGKPITVTARTDGEAGAQITWAGGSTNVGPNTNVFGGAHNSDILIPTSSIIMSGGTLRNVIGGGLHKSHVGKSSVSITGGAVVGVVGGGASSFVNDKTCGCGNPWYAGDETQSPCKVDNANVTVSGGVISSLLYGGGEGISYTGTAVMHIDGGDMSKAWVTAGGSNGYTGEGKVRVDGADANIKVLQGVNRGSMDKIELYVTDGVIENMYIGGETGDSSVTGTYKEASADISGGKVANFYPGSNGTSGTNSTDKLTDGKVLYLEGTVTNTSNLSDDFGDKLTHLVNVSFDSQGGSKVDPCDAVYGYPVSAPADPTYEGLRFDGWYKEATCETKWDFENDAVTANTTLYAKWVAPSGDPQTTIIIAPATVTLPYDGAVKVTAPAAPAGSVYSYEWQTSTDEGANWSKIDGADENVYTIGNEVIQLTNSGWLYRCNIGNQETGKDPVYKLSNTVTLNVVKGTQEAPTTPAGGTEKITGVTTAMEYQAKGAAVWTACPDGSITGLSAGAYLVRYAETEFLSASAPIEVTVSAYSGGGGGGGGSTPTPPPTVETNPDGSTTKTETAKDGTVTETTEHKDGTVQVVETKPDGTVTESVKTPDGLEAKAVTSPDGKVEAEVVIPAAKAEAGTVELPISELPVTKDAEKAPVVTVKSDKPVTVAVPVAQAAPGMVAVIVNADGTEEIVTKSVLVDGALVVPLEAGATVKLVDKSVDFADAAQAAWAGDAIAFVSSHELFQGTGEGSFSPNQPMNRAMLVTVLHRLESKPQAGVAAQFADVDSGAYYTDAVAWASESGIVTGTGAGFDPDAPISREQLATILYRYMAKQGVQAEQGNLNAFADGGAVSPWAQEAMGYAVGAGLMTGKDGGVLDPQGTATRAEVAVVLQRLVETMAR